MKITKKLLAFVIAFAMVASVMVMPVSVSAAEVNLAHSITAIADNQLTITQPRGAKASDAAPAAQWAFTSGGPRATFADGVVSLTQRSNGDSKSGMILKNAPLKSGKTYAVSVDLRTDSFNIGSLRTAAIYLKNIDGSKASYLNGKNIKEDTASDYTYVAGEIGTRKQLAIPGQETNGPWVHFFEVFTLGTNADAEEELGIDIGFSVGKYDNSTTFLYSFKNFKIVEVDSNALVPVIDSISFPTINQYGGAKASDEAAAPAWAGTRATSNSDKLNYELVEEDGEKVVKITKRATYEGHIAGVWLTNAALKSGKTYKVSVDLRADTFTTGASRYANIIIKDIAGSKATIKEGKGILQEDTTVKMGSGTWNIYAGMLDNNVSLAASGAGTGLWDWVHIERVFTMGTNPEGTAELGANIGFQVGESSNYNVYNYSFKNFELVEATPLTGTAVANGSKAATFTFSNAVTTAPTFAVTTTAAGAKTPALTVTENNGAYEVKMAGYSVGTTYTITATGGVDEFGQALAVPVSVDVTTPALEEGVVSGMITGMVNDAIVLDGAVKASESALEPVWEAGTSVTGVYADDVVSLKTRAYSSKSGFVLKNAPLKSGRTYTISVDLRADEFQTGNTGEARKAALFIEDIAGSKATITDSEGIYTDADAQSGGRTTGEIGDRISVAVYGAAIPGNWMHYEKTFTMGTNPEGTAELGANIGFAVGDNGNANKFLYSFKNFKIVEVPSTAFEPANIASGYTLEVEEAEGNAVLTVAGPDATIVYFLAFNDATKAVKFAKATVADGAATLTIGADDNFKYMIWDSNLNPLCDAFMGTDF